MKKLLFTFGTTILTSTTIFTVVSCSQNNTINISDLAKLRPTLKLDSVVSNEIKIETIYKDLIVNGGWNKWFSFDFTTINGLQKLIDDGDFKVSIDASFPSSDNEIRLNITWKLNLPEYDFREIESNFNLGELIDDNIKLIAWDSDSSESDSRSKYLNDLILSYKVQLNEYFNNLTLNIGEFITQNENYKELSKDEINSKVFKGKEPNVKINITKSRDSIISLDEHQKNALIVFTIEGSEQDVNSDPIQLEFGTII